MTEYPQRHAEPTTDPCGTHLAEFFHGEDIQARFGALLMAFNAAYHDLLEAVGPTAITSTDEPDVYEIEIRGAFTVSTLTAEVVPEGARVRLEPIDLKVTSFMPVFPVFSYDGECRDAHIVRLMTCWLEKAFLVHEGTILAKIAGGPVHIGDGNN